MEDDRYWLHSSPLVATTVVPLKGAREPPLGAPGLRVRTGNEPRHELGLSLGERHAGLGGAASDQGAAWNLVAAGPLAARPRRRSQSLTTPDAEGPRVAGQLAPPYFPGVIPWAARPPVRRPGTLRPCRCLSLRAYPRGKP